MLIQTDKKKRYSKILGAAALASVFSSAAFADGSGSAAAPAAAQDGSSSGPSAAGAAPGAAMTGVGAAPSMGGLSAAGGPAPENGLPFGSWMLYPSIFLGGAYNDNVYLTSTNRVSEFGALIAPNIEADLDEGLYKATLYANANAQLYPGYNAVLGESATTVSGRAGFALLWSPTSDVTGHFSLDFTRSYGAFGSPLITNSLIGTATSFVLAPMAMSFSPFQQATNTATASLYVEKNLSDATFVRVGGGLQQISYDSPPNGYYSAPNGISPNAFIRGGYRLTPDLNAFVEVGGYLYRYYNASYFNSNNYYVIAGLSSGMIGLFRGQIYGGYQEQYSTAGAFSPQAMPDFGGSLTYYPTEYLTIAANVSSSFGAATGFGVAPVGGLGVNPLLYANNRLVQARLQADYKMFEYWTASVFGGYAEAWYPGTLYSGGPSGSSATWTAGAGVAYNFWRNVALTLNYQYAAVNSSGFGLLSYSNNVATLGVTYKY
jgi:opacity protein-like surface antigen